MTKSPNSLAPLNTEWDWTSPGFEFEPIDFEFEPIDFEFEPVEWEWHDVIFD